MLLMHAPPARKGIQPSVPRPWLSGCTSSFALRQRAAARAPTSARAGRTMVTEAFSAPGQLLFRQLFDSGSSTFTYILADAASKEAVMIDPVLEQVDRDLGLLKELELQLLYAINTHCHADHVTGTGEIKKRLPNVRSGISRASRAEADILFEPGDIIAFGTQTLQALPTPGHTNGCMCFYSTADGGRVFTGDTLLIRGCGRTDFQEGSAERLYDSVHSQLFSLPDNTAVYPAHDYKGRTSSTVGEEKWHNLRLTQTKEQFINIMANLGLPYPKKIDEAVPANMMCGLQSD